MKRCPIAAKIAGSIGILFQITAYIMYHVFPWLTKEKFTKKEENSFM